MRNWRAFTIALLISASAEETDTARQKLSYSSSTMNQTETTATSDPYIDLKEISLGTFSQLHFLILGDWGKQERENKRRCLEEEAENKEGENGEKKDEHEDEHENEHEDEHEDGKNVKLNCKFMQALVDIISCHYLLL